MWSADGSELFFVDSEGSLAAVRIGQGSRPVEGAPEVLFGGLYFSLGAEVLYAVGADGDRIMVVRDVGETTEKPKLMLVQNWFAEFEDH